MKPSARPDVAHARDFSRDADYIKECARSPLTWLANEFWINTPLTQDGVRRECLIELNVEQVRFLKDVERQLRETGRVRTIVLKSRRLGFTTIIAGLAVWAAKFLPFTNVEGVTHHSKLTPAVNRMVSLALKHSKSGSEWSREDGIWKFANGSIINPYYTQGGDENKGRGGDPTFLHLLEMPSWESSRKETSAADVAQGLFAALIDAPNTFLIIESTAGAVGDFFHDRWAAAVSGKDAATTPLFFSWTENKRHAIKNPDPMLRSVEGARYAALVDACAREDEPEQIAHAQALNLDGTELELVRDHQLTMDQLRWRRATLVSAACNSDEERFNREYPVSPEHAFSATGTQVFKAQQIAARLRVLADFTPHVKHAVLEPDVGDTYAFKSAFFIGGGWEVYQPPSPGRSYIVSADVADGGTTDEANYSCIQILERATLTQVAEFYAKTPPDTLASQIAWGAALYNGAHVVVESNKSGVLVIHILQEQYAGSDLYRHFIDPHEVVRNRQEPESRIGWMTTEQSRRFCIGVFEMLFRTNRITLYSKRLLREMTTFIRAKNTARPQAQRRSFDDAILAICIGVAVHQETPLSRAPTETPSFSADQDSRPIEWDSALNNFVARPMRELAAAAEYAEAA